MEQLDISNPTLYNPLKHLSIESELAPLLKLSPSSISGGSFERIGYQFSKLVIRSFELNLWFMLHWLTKMINASCFTGDRYLR